MGFILIVCIVMFVVNTFVILIYADMTTLWSFLLAISINLFLSTVLFSLYNIKDYLGQLVEKKAE
ncbi:hypothetical protein AXY_18330 [Amphibacillus xylanus NBRC 15112]|uniref:Uncharacterized protein n=1 Tax=Amphibacillus xylanus (strain ATCC 51415 / DSM 6626 / JCM 7361 / LMG 17667 / NBRC 15112 / Ep01) TaxID=698758 RepID=K0IZI5_AMPXN|nr:hypothetical protein AXY_18330 [Amphibacillus xylanus NBRC 15112]